VDGSPVMVCDWPDARLKLDGERKLQPLTNTLTVPWGQIFFTLTVREALGLMFDGVEFDVYAVPPLQAASSKKPPKTIAWRKRIFVIWVVLELFTQAKRAWPR